MGKDFIVGLDIGTSSIKAAVAENKKGYPVLRGVFAEPSLGLQRGSVFDLTEASQSIGRVLSEIRKIHRRAVKNIYVGIGTPQVKVQSSKGVVAVSRADNEIYRDDVDRVVRASQAINLLPNRMIIHTITRDFVIDGIGDISDPLGLSGNRLEVNALVVDAFTPHIKGLIKVIDLVGGEIGGLVFAPLASSRSVLSKVQKDLGTVLVDIGFGTTGMSVYEENRLVGLGKFPVGAHNISKDLAVGLKIPLLAAENLKLNYGSAMSREVAAREMIELKKFSPETHGSVSRRFIAEIIEARLAEIFDFVNNELKLIGRAGKLAGGVVLVGGGAKLPGITELARQELKLFSQVGFTNQNEWFKEVTGFTEAMEDPEYVNALGLVLWGADQEHWWPTSQGASNFMGSMKDFLSYFKP
ncbi:MAG: cell division protein FtsA [Candidatus Liptonbacteria bacterium]|nr:cell division protein FtsA [Candidatus Liptonbacteria bacterium]